MERQANKTGNGMKRGGRLSGACLAPSRDASCWRRRSRCSRRFYPLPRIWLWYGWGDLFLAGEGPLAQADASKVHEIALLLVMAFLSQLFFRALALIITHFADMKLRYVIRKGIVERLSRAPLAWFSATESGKVRSAVQDDTKTVHTVIAHGPVDRLNGVLQPMVLLAFMFWINWRLALIGIATIPFYFLLQALSMKDMGPKTAEMNGHLAQVSSTMVELVSGIKVVKAFGKQERRIVITRTPHRHSPSRTGTGAPAHWALLDCRRAHLLSLTSAD